MKSEETKLHLIKKYNKSPTSHERLVHTTNGFYRGPQKISLKLDKVENLIIPEVARSQRTSFK